METALDHLQTETLKAAESEGGDVMGADIKQTEETEQKQISTFDFELKALEEEKGVIEGYGSTFGNVDRGYDTIEKGAFGSAKTVPLLYMHDPRQVIGSAKVWEDDKGLRFKAQLLINAESQTLKERALEVYDLVKSGAVQKTSIGFIPLQREWTERMVRNTKRSVRVIKSVDLLELSVVPIPMNDKASIQTVKSFDEAELKQMIENAIAPFKQEIEALKQLLEQANKSIEPNHIKVNAKEPPSKTMINQQLKTLIYRTY